MNNAMLWWIDEPKAPLSKSILAAAEYYAKKFDRVPELCLLNEQVPAADVADVVLYGNVITVKTYKGVVPGHLQMGVEDQAAFIPVKGRDDVKE